MVNNGHKNETKSKFDVSTVADTERDPLVLLMDDIGLMFSWRWMSANIPQYSQCGGFIRSVSASFYSFLSFPPDLSIDHNLKLKKWDLTFLPYKTFAKFSIS